eukprot:12183387-Prorocentrum_lima.AAC.1
MPPPSQWRPGMQQLGTAGSVSLPPSGSNEHPGRPPKRTMQEQPGPNAFLQKCAHERRRKLAVQRE